MPGRSCWRRKAKRQGRGHRPGQDPHRQAGRLAHRDPARHRRRFGARHDQRIIAEGLADQDYVEQYTLGIEELTARAAEFPPERVAEITGIPADDIRQLAREYATTQPSAIRQGVAIERSRGGGQAIRAITCLPALVGAWRHVGGGTVEMPIWEFPPGSTGSAGPTGSSPARA